MLSTTLAVVLLMPFTVDLLVCAFTPPVIVTSSAATTTTTTTTRRALLVLELQQSSVSVEDSEWYCPPPAPKAAVPAKSRILPGHKALQIDVITAQELENLVHGEDGRLTIVKFYASW